VKVSDELSRFSGVWGQALQELALSWLLRLGDAGTRAAAVRGQASSRMSYIQQPMCSATHGVGRTAAQGTGIRLLSQHCRVLL